MNSNAFNMIVDNFDQESQGSEGANRLFEDFLLERNLKVFKLKPGSTIFNALADQIYLNEELSDRVEVECKSYWENHTSTFGPTNPQLSTQQVNQTILSIAANLYKRKVIVFLDTLDVLEYSPTDGMMNDEPIYISQYSTQEIYHSVINKMRHGPRRVRLSNMVQRVPSDIETKIDNEIRKAFEQGLILTERQESYHSSLDFDQVRPIEEIDHNTFDGLPMNVQLTFQDASTEDLNEIDDHSSVSSIGQCGGGLIAKVARTNYHSPNISRKYGPPRPAPFNRRGSSLTASDFESTSSSKEDFSTDFSTEVTEPSYCELRG